MYVNAGRVYILQSEEGQVKVGCSKDVKFRAHTIETISGRRIVNVWYTRECSNYRFIERQAHKTLDMYRTVGEWFNCDFCAAKTAVINAFEKFAEFDFQTEEATEKYAKEVANHFAKIFLPKLLYEEQAPAEKLNLERWVPSEDDKKIIMQFLMDDYIGTLECADEEAAQEYIDLYRKVEKEGVCSCKEEIQDVVCEYFWAVNGEIETFYNGDTDILEIMNLTILKEPVSV